MSRALAAIFLLGLGLTGWGWILTSVGLSDHAQNTRGDKPSYMQWVLDTMGSLGTLLVGPHSDLGQRLASVGVVVGSIVLSADWPFSPFSAAATRNGLMIYEPHQMRTVRIDRRI